jgi:hypothetical protein
MSIKAIVLAMALLTAAPLVANAQKTGTAPDQAPPSQAAPPNQAPPAATAAALRILSPHEGERLKQDFIHVQFELTNSGASAAGTPTFELQLDSLDPVTTSSNDYTFTGLAPGAHKITVQLIDANGTPISGAAGQVQFFILRPTATLRHKARALAAALRVEDSKQQPLRDMDGHELPAAGGALPLLSVIGFGALLGGIASAMKTR